VLLRRVAAARRLVRADAVDKRPAIREIAQSWPDSIRGQERIPMRALQFNTWLHCAFVLLVGAMQCPLTRGGETFPARRFANLDTESVELLKEFHTAYGRLKSFYANAELKAKVEKSRVALNEGIRTPTAGLVLEQQIEYEYRSLEERFYRVDYEMFAPGTRDLTGAGRGVIHPDECFLFRRNPDSQALSVIRHTKDQKEFHELLQSVLISILPYSFGADLLEHEIFERADASIESISLAGHGRAEIATVVRRIVVENVGENTTTFCLLRNQSWAVQSIEGTTSRLTSSGLKATDRYVQRCEYQGETNSFPHLKSATFEIYGDDESAEEPPLWSRQSIQVSSFRPGGAPESDFDVSTMVSNVERIQERTTSPSRILIGTGVFLVVLGVWMARRPRPAKSTSIDL